MKNFNLKMFIGLIMIANAYMANATVKSLSPAQYSAPSGVFVKATKMLEADNITTAKIAYSGALDILNKEKNDKYPPVIKNLQMMLQNVFNLRVGLDTPNEVLVTLCYSMTSGTLSKSASKPERKFRSVLYKKCKSSYKSVFGKPSVSEKDLNFKLQSSDILTFDENTNVLLIGNKKLSTTKAIKLKAVYIEPPKKIVVSAPLIDLKTWDKVMSLYPSGVSELTFKYKNNQSKVEIISEDKNKQSEIRVMSLQDFLNIEPEIQYEMAKN